MSRAARKQKPPVQAPPWDKYKSAFEQTFLIPGITILPLRIFLGLTFIYAGWQKLTDPGFMRLGSRTYIGTQLLGFSHGSPIHFLLQHMLEHAQFFGAMTILTEIVVGCLVLVGLLTRPAAIVGMGLNLVLFLSATWHVYPYFLGSDIVFVVAWLTLALTGPGGYALDSLITWPLSRTARNVITGPMETMPAPAALPNRVSHTDSASLEPATARNGQQAMPTSVSVVPASLRGPLTRREALIGAVASVAVVVLGLWPRTTPSSSGSLSPSATKSTGGATVKPTKAAGASGPPPSGTKVGNTSQLSPNSALAITDPKSGDPAVVIRTANNEVFAYDAVCTHAGCTVQYDPNYKLLVCPCHGGAFDPAHGATVVAGPPPSPLTQLPLKVDGQGNIYLT